MHFGMLHKGVLKHLIHVGHRHELYLFLDAFGDIPQIALIVFGKQDFPVAGPVGGQRFLLQPPIGSTRPRSVISPVMATSLET